jgi:hypothetical protein
MKPLRPKKLSGAQLLRNFAPELRATERKRLTPSAAEPSGQPAKKSLTGAKKLRGLGENWLPSSSF